VLATGAAVAVGRFAQTARAARSTQP
jgi:hypothetical protein